MVNILNIANGMYYIFFERLIKMEDFEKEELVDGFVSKLEYNMSELEKFIKFIYFEPTDTSNVQRNVLEGINIIKKKIKKIKKSKSLKEKSKYLKVKKICKREKK